MSLTLIPYPESSPTLDTDYQKQNNLLAAGFLYDGMINPVDYDNDLIPQGTIVTIGGAVYKATADESITGTASNYVKVTPSGDGLTATASYISSLTGVTWNSVYNHYIDTGSPASLYLFSEGLALINGAITEAHTRFGFLKGLYVGSLKADSIESITLSKTATQRIALTKTTITNEEFTVNYPCYLILRSTAISGHNSSNYYACYLTIYEDDTNYPSYIRDITTGVNVNSYTTGLNNYFVMPGTYLITITTVGSPSPTEVDLSLDVRSAFGTSDYTNVLT